MSKILDMRMRAAHTQGMAVFYVPPPIAPNPGGMLSMRPLPAGITAKVPPVAGFTPLSHLDHMATSARRIDRVVLFDPDAPNGSSLRLVDASILGESRAKA